MGIFNWLSIKKNSDSTPPRARRGEITVEKAIAFSDEIERLGKFFIFLKNHAEMILSTQSEIEEKIEQLKAQTNQNLKKEELFKELYILRYTALSVWFFDLKEPENQNEVEENLKLINRAFQSVLEKDNKADYLLWLQSGFAEYSGTDKLNFNNVKNLKKNFVEKVGEKIPLIAFHSTEGRLAGELHDGVVELIMTTIQQDQKAFELSDDVALTKEENENIKKTIDGMKPTEQDFEDFINSLEENIG